MFSSRSSVINHGGLIGILIGKMAIALISVLVLVTVPGEQRLHHVPFDISIPLVSHFLQAQPVLIPHYIITEGKTAY